VYAGRLAGGSGREGNGRFDPDRGLDPRGEDSIGVEHAAGSACAYGWSRNPQGGNRDECAATHDSFGGDGGGLCDSGVGEEGVEVPEFTESFWGRLVDY